jgi:outer membrane receptor for monomeric catechols
VVTYKPTEYGTTPTGKLVIQTEDAMWSYLVRGSHPKYTAPIVDRGRVTTRLSKVVLNKLVKAKVAAKKNFIKSNISATKSKTLNIL